MRLAPFANALLERVKELLGQPCKRKSRLQIGTGHGGTIVFAITVSSSRQVVNPKRLICTMTHLRPLPTSPRVLNEFPHHVSFRYEVPPAYTILLEPGEGAYATGFLSAEQLFLLFGIIGH